MTFKRPASLLVVRIVIASLCFLPAEHGLVSAQKVSRRAGPENWRRAAPRPGPSRPFTVPSIREAPLPDGLRLIMIEDHRTPMVTFAMGIRVGRIDDPPGESALAEALADLIVEGAGSRTGEELAREVETLGGQIGASAGEDRTEVSASVISQNAEPMLQIIADVVMRPTFPESEVALYKNTRIQKLQVQRQDPSYLVSEHFNRVIYGSHPYAISSPTTESVAALSRSKIASFHRSHFTPDRSALVVAGDFEGDKMREKVKAAFADWRTSAPRGEKLPQMPDRKQRRVYLMDRPGSEQADFRVGNLALARTDPDYYALLVASTILGGGTSSRLFLNLRERKGYTYDVSTSIYAPRERGTFFGACETRTEVTLPAIKDMLAEFNRLRNVNVTASDLRNAKSYLNGVFSLTLSTQGGLADRILNARLLDLPSDYLQSYRTRIEAVTADQIRRVARKYMLTDRAAIVVVGDAAKLAKPLRSLGPVEVVDTEGKVSAGAQR